MKETTPLEAWIGGQRFETSGQLFETRNPASGQCLRSVRIADAETIEAAVQSASEGLAVWAAMTGAERGRILLRAAEILRARNSELARLESHDTGKPIQETEAVDITSGADCLAYFGGLAAGLSGEHIDLGNAFAYTRREPLGICAAIGAWNYPCRSPAGKQRRRWRVATA